MIKHLALSNHHPLARVFKFIRKIILSMPAGHLEMKGSDLALVEVKYQRLSPKQSMTSYSSNCGFDFDVSMKIPQRHR